MEPISNSQFKAYLSRARIVVADPNLNIGKDLSYSETALRRVVVYFGESDSQIYVSKVISILFEVEEDWFLIPRFGTASDLHIIEGENVSAILYRPPDRQNLVEYLFTRSMDLGGFSADLYVLSRSGDILIIWDHHTASEGLKIDFCKVVQSTQFLSALNELGSEFEVYHLNR
jgi:hypothetical protein